MKFLETINHIREVKDLRQRILVTFLFVLIYRFGSFVVLPGIDPLLITGEDTALTGQTREGLMALLDMFSGGAFSHASIFALGIMPYISASIVVQLLTIAVPYFQKMQKDGESGRKKMTQITRYLTVIILIVQGFSYLVNLSFQMRGIVPDSFGFRVNSVILLCAGSMFVMWLGERITDKGVGQGISIIILVGIIARFPDALLAEFVACMGESGGLIKMILEIIALFAVSCAAILLVQGVRKVPVQYAKRMVQGQEVTGARQYIPLKVNAANVMPIIFAQAIMFIPLVFSSWDASNAGSSFSAMWRDNNSLVYNIIFATLIILFTYFYVAIIINPTQMAEDMKRNNGFIPEVKAGAPTAEYIDTIMSRITLPGAFFLAAIAVLPAVARFFGITNQFAQFFGGTSLLIVVGVVLDTLQQVESHLLSRHYDGLLDSGRIRSRSGVDIY
ncbi:MAG: preprotein translocase subunit SecY [Paludibacteraceae bacterium]|nr:preprotein translocase subunit SecY [Paludibacteraceae bacterium]